MRADFEAGVAAFEQGNYARAILEFRRLAEKGDALAQFNLGLLYELGLGAEADAGEAIRWYRRAAEQGVPAAQNNLGAIFKTGRGVAPDDAQAFAWYRRAAEQGFTEAQYNLAVLYDTGQGVERNLVEAYRWFSLVADDERGSDYQELARVNRGIVASQLSPEALARAQGLAEAWRAKPEAPAK